MRLAAYAGALTNLAGKASHTGGPPVTGFAPPRDHGAAVEALHASGLVYHPLRG